jgi:hypothetical protein
MQHDDYHVIEDAFIEGFRAAPDKRAFLQLARIPFEIEDAAGGFKLLDVKLNDSFSVGAASPGFGSSELVYHPLPGEMVTCKTALTFVYVSARETRAMTLADVLKATGEDVADGGPDHHHNHHHHHHA